MLERARGLVQTWARNIWIRAQELSYDVLVGPLLPAELRRSIVAVATLAGSFAGRQFETAQRLREAAEREAWTGEARLNAILDNVVDAIITIDGRGRIQRWSPSAERIFGYSEAETVGQGVAMLMPEPDRSRRGWSATRCGWGRC